MSEYFTILTKNGLNKVIKSVTDNTPIVLSKMAVSDDKSEINQDNTVLKSVKHKFSINAVTQDPNDSNVLICEGIINADVGGFYIRKIGVYTDDDMLFAIGKVPESYKPVLNEGSAKDITIKFMLQIDNSANITLKVDNNIVLATRSYVNSEISKLNKVYLGKEEKATDSDKLDGLDSTKFLKKEDKIDWENIQNKPNLNVSSLPVGTIISFIGGVEPENALYCDGRAISRTEYVDLFTSIGVTYGAGDGSTTFNLPDLRGLFLRGSGGNAAPIGQKQNDAIRNIVGKLSYVFRGRNWHDEAAGPFNLDKYWNAGIGSGGSDDWGASVSFDVSRVVPTANENRPVNTAVKYYIVYKGKTTGSTPNTQNPELFLKKSEMDTFISSQVKATLGALNTKDERVLFNAKSKRKSVVWYTNNTKNALFVIFGGNSKISVSTKKGEYDEDISLTPEQGFFGMSVVPAGWMFKYTYADANNVFIFELREKNEIF